MSWSGLIVLKVLTLLAGFLIHVSASSGSDCPHGYRLHYQGFCISKEDELEDDPIKGVRTVSPAKLQGSKSYLDFDPLAKTGYKFSNMKHGEFCKKAFVRLSRTNYTHPVAYALGEQSCGFSESDVASIEAAEAHALAECTKHTEDCRIVFPEKQ